MIRLSLPVFLITTLILASSTTACTSNPDSSTPAGSSTNSTQTLDTEKLVTVKLPVSYIPNIQFAPYYVAIEKGYYRDAGIQVELDYSTETDSIALLGANQIQFAVVSGDQVLLGRAQEIPIVYVMTWYQDYPIGIASKPDQGIQTPEDLRGKTVGLPILSGASYIGFRALIAAAGLTEDDIHIETIGFTQVESLAQDQVDAAVVYAANEPAALKAQGIDINLLKVSDYTKLIANGLATNQTTLENHPDLVRGMVRATLQGIQDTAQDPQGAYEISKKYVETLAQADQEIQMQVLTNSIQFYHPDLNGMSDPQAWENMQQVLIDMQLLTTPLDLSQAYSNDYLP